METRVTALVVAHRDVDHLRRTLTRLGEQTRRPDRVVAVAFDSTDEIDAELRAHRLDQIVSVKEQVPFGHALAAGVEQLGTAAGDQDFLWLLAQDTAPEPDALRALLAVFENSPSAGAVGPKLVDWDDSKRLRGAGETMTTSGATVRLVEDQLDQGQHDIVSDVLAVASAGMLVRRTVWDHVGGFDPALDPTDDGLDFCVRVRLTGRRVVLAPGAKVAVAGDGVAARSRSRRWKIKQRRARVSRTAELHRRLVYAPAVNVVFLWALLVPLAVLRSIRLLVRKEPELIASEFRAAFRVALGGTRVRAARKRLASSKSVGWSVLDDFLLTPREARRRRKLDREIGDMPVSTTERSDLRFLTGGGGWAVIASGVLGVSLFIGLIPGYTVTGGGLLPLSPHVADLWGNAVYGWRSIGDGFVGAADPFAAVLAVLGTLTFWQPSYALVLLWILALPLATLTAWFACTRLTETSGYRLLGAAAWTLSPTFLIALAEGRPASVIVHILLPLLFSAGAVAARSWPAAAAASMLLAAIGACAPSLIPALAVLWVVAIVLARGRAGRVLFIPFPLLALFAPLVWQQGIRSANWLGIFADPGRPLPSEPGSALDLLLGFPHGDAGGWSAFASDLGWPQEIVQIGVPVVVALIALVGAVGLFLPGWPRNLILWGCAALGYATAVAAGHVAVTFVGTDTTAIWPGTALSLMSLGIVGAVVATCDALHRHGAVPAAASVVLAGALAVPALVALPVGNGDIHSGDGRTLPAYVTAAASSDPGLGTLRVSPEDDGTLVATVVRGPGEYLNTQSTLVDTGSPIADSGADLAALTGNLVSSSGADLAPQLADRGIGFILVSEPVGADDEGKAASLESRAHSALDANSDLENVGETDAGTLWRTADEVSGIDRGTVWTLARALSLAVLVLALVAALLIGIPTSASREAARMTPRTVGPRPGGDGMETRTDEAEPATADGEQAESDPEWADVVVMPGASDPQEADAAEDDAAEADTTGAVPPDTDARESEQEKAAGSAEPSADTSSPPRTDDDDFEADLSQQSDDSSDGREGESR